MSYRKGLGGCSVCGSTYQYDRMSRTRVCSDCFGSTVSYCQCGCGQKVLNPDIRGRYRRYIYGHQNKLGLNRKGKSQSEEEITKRTKSLLKHFRTKEPTCIERELYEFLDSMNIVYEPQKQFGRTVADAFVPSLELAIYADGAYWHNRPEVVEQDSRSNKRILSMGLKLLRLKSIDNGYHLDLDPLKHILCT